MLELSDPLDLVAAVDAVIQKNGLTVRANGAVAANIILSASGDFYESADGSWDYEKITSWFDDNKKALQERFPNQIAAMRLDLDESTPHIDAIIVPYYLKRTKHTESLVVSYRKKFGGDRKSDASKQMQELQSWYAARMRPFGLRRGVPKSLTGVVGLTHQQYRARKAAIEAENIEAVRRLQLLQTQQQQILESLRQKEMWLDVARKNAKEELMKLGHLMSQISPPDQRMVVKRLADIYRKDDTSVAELEAAAYGP